MVVAILAGAWAAALLWPWLRKRSDAQPATSIASFRNQITSLERTTPASGRGRGMVPVGGQRYVPITYSLDKPAAFPIPRTRAEVRKRRRDVLFTLLGLDLLTLLLVAIGVGFVAFAMFLLTVGLTAGYVFLLVQIKRLAAERVRKVRTIDLRTPARATGSLLESNSISS